MAVTTIRHVTKLEITVSVAMWMTHRLFRACSFPRQACRLLILSLLFSVWLEDCADLIRKLATMLSWPLTDSDQELMEELMGHVGDGGDGLDAAPLDDVDAEFGGREARLNLERRLLRKLDTRMSILVLIYIFNYVRLSRRRRSVYVAHLCSQVDRNNAA